MRRTEKRQESEPRTYTETVEVTCDLCGAVAPDPTEAGEYGSGAWNDNSYEFDEIRVDRIAGSHYPGDDRTVAIREEFDICPTCWKTKLVPWLREQGVSTTESDS